MTIKLLLVSAINNGRPVEQNCPSLGLGYIASALREKFGNEIVCRIANHDINGAIKSFCPDVVGITCVTKNYSVAMLYAAIAKQYNLPVIMGGVQISFLPHVLTADMDVGVDGEGERTIVELMGLFRDCGSFDKRTLPGINGIIFEDQGEIVKTKPRDLIRPLDDVPYPARDLLCVGKSAHLISSRGCPYHCAYCSTSLHMRNQLRYASAEYVTDEIESLYRDYKIEYLTIYDDLFAIDTRRIIKIQELMSKKNLIGKFGMAANIRADLITDEMAEVLRQMNFTAISIGMDSGCPKVLSYLKSGNATVEHNAVAIERLRRHHIAPYCSFIIGSPGETLADAKQTFKFIKSNNITDFDINVLTPYPGTAVWDYALSHGLVGNDMDWGRLDFYIAPNTVTVSDKMSREQMGTVLKKAYLWRAKQRSSANWRSLATAVLEHPVKYAIYFAKIVVSKMMGLLK